METSALFRGVAMFFVIDALPTSVPFHQICLNWLQPSEVRQITFHGEEFVV